MKIIVTLVLMTTTLLSFGQSKMDMVLYPCGTKQMDRAISIATDTTLNQFNVTIIPKCPSPNYPYTPAKIDFFMSGVVEPLSTLYCNEMPTDSTLNLILIEADKLFREKYVTISLNRFAQ